MDGSRLFASRNLDPLWVPPLFASPSLHRTPAGALSWYWLCDLTFLSWLEAKAARHADRLTPEMHFQIALIRSHVYHDHGVTDGDTSALLPPGAKLPSETMFDSLGLCGEHGPRWAGIEECATSAGFVGLDRLEARDVEAYRRLVAEGGEFRRRRSEGEDEDDDSRAAPAAGAPAKKRRKKS